MITRVVEAIFQPADVILSEGIPSDAADTELKFLEEMHIRPTTYHSGFTVTN